MEYQSADALKVVIEETRFVNKIQRTLSVETETVI